MKVLIVDDDKAKAETISGVLATIPELVSTDIVTAPDLRAAKLLIAESLFDLVVLDIAIPRLPGGEVRKDGGLELIDELEMRDIYHTPMRIIGMTAYDDIYDDTRDRFAKLQYTFIHYDKTDSSWKESLHTTVSQLLATTQAQERVRASFATELAVICALPDVELGAVRALPWNWQSRIYPDDGTTYYEGTFNRQGSLLNVVAASSGRMGMPAAAVLASKLCYRYRPRIVAMVGVAAGVSKHTSIGDIVVADPCWDCGSGKWIIDGESISFQQAPHQIPLHPFLRERCRDIQQDANFVKSVFLEFEGVRPEDMPSIAIGPLASTAAVLADGVSVPRIMNQHRQALGVDMEAYGVSLAAVEGAPPHPYSIVIKTVVDFADGTKNDKFQPFGAYASAAVLRHLVENVLPIDWGN